MDRLHEIYPALREIHSHITPKASWEFDLHIVRSKFDEEQIAAVERVMILGDTALDILGGNKDQVFSKLAQYHRRNLPPKLIAKWQEVRAWWFHCLWVTYSRSDKGHADSPEEETIVDSCWRKECALLALWPHTDGFQDSDRPPHLDWLNVDETISTPLFDLKRPLDDYELSRLTYLFEGIDRLQERQARAIAAKREAEMCVEATLEFLRTTMDGRLSLAFRREDNGRRKAIGFDELKAAILDGNEMLELSDQLVAAAKLFAKTAANALMAQNGTESSIGKILQSRPRLGTKIDIESAFKRIVSSCQDQGVEKSESQLHIEMKQQFDNITRGRIRELRRKFAPENWKKPGRRKSRS